jgi:hypothetical protein
MNPTTNTPDAVFSELDLLNVVGDIASLGHRCVGDLAAIFVAIGRMTDDPTIKSLTCSAGYLAEDWQRLIAEEAHEHNQRRTVLYAERSRS